MLRLGLLGVIVLGIAFGLGFAFDSGSGSSSGSMAQSVVVRYWVCTIDSWA